MPLLADPRRAAVDGLTLAAVVWAREAAIEALLEIRVAVREPDAGVFSAVLDEAVLDALDATVLDAAALDATALDVVVLCAAGFDEEGLAAADARARGGVR
jgi:hypothetical protein